VIVIEPLRFAWGPGAPDTLVLDRLHVDAGQTVFLHGPSGCGDWSPLPGSRTPGRSQYQIHPGKSRGLHRLDRELAVAPGQGLAGRTGGRQRNQLSHRKPALVQQGQELLTHRPCGPEHSHTQRAPGQGRGAGDGLSLDSGQGEQRVREGAGALKREVAGTGRRGSRDQGRLSRRLQLRRNRVRTGWVRRSRRVRGLDGWMGVGRERTGTGGLTDVDER
jgi:hypothetical protein